MTKAELVSFIAGETKVAKNSDAGAFVTRDELKLLEMRMNDAIAAEGKRVENSIRDDMKAAMNGSSISEKAADKSVAATRTTSSKAEKPAKTTAGSTLQISEAEKQSYMKEGIKYVVQPGDTLSSIARKNHSSVRAIIATNSITTPSKLYVGREIFVPTL